MNIEIYPEIGDKVQIKVGNVLEIIADQPKDGPYTGADIMTGEPITFNKDNIACIKKSYIKSCGGDGTNFWMFYTGASYKTSLIDVVHYAWFELTDIFGNMSEEEIIKNHIYWGSDESYGMKGAYNGDTYILYNNINALPQDYQFDAQNARE